MRGKEQQRRMFRLTATVISMLILSVAILGLSPMVFSVIRATVQSREMTKASTQLQNKSETSETTRYKLAHLGK